MNRRGLDTVSARSESQDLHAVVRVLLQSVQNGLARGGDLGVLGVLVVPGVGGSVDDLDDEGCNIRRLDSWTGKGELQSPCIR